jgi:hypothetical protein
MADESIMVGIEAGDSLATEMNQSASFPSGIEAAALFRQGRAPSIAGAAVGYGLWNLLKPREKRDLPRTFVLAITESEAIAFRGRGVGSEDSGDYWVTVWSEPLGTWPRSGITIERGPKGMSTNVLIDLGGERITCASQADELLEDLGAKLGTIPGGG